MRIQLPNISRAFPTQNREDVGNVRKLLSGTLGKRSGNSIPLISHDFPTFWAKMSKFPTSSRENLGTTRVVESRYVDTQLLKS
jgi:hypothetical protein